MVERVQTSHRLRFHHFKLLIPWGFLFSDETFTFSASLQRRNFDTKLNRWNYTHFCGGVLLQVYKGMAVVASAGHCLKNKQVKRNNNKKTHSESIVIKFIEFSHHRKDGDVSVVFGAKNLLSSMEHRFDNVTLFPRDYDM